MNISSNTNTYLIIGKKMEFIAVDSYFNWLLLFREKPINYNITMKIIRKGASIEQ